jgi:hypothetical protein
MLMRNQKTSLNTDADFALPGTVAPFPQTRVFVIKHPVATLTWPTREQRERE